LRYWDIKRELSVSHGPVTAGLVVLVKIFYRHLTLALTIVYTVQRGQTFDRFLFSVFVQKMECFSQPSE